MELSGPVAEQAASRVGRGSKVVVHGFLAINEWTDKSGQLRSNIKVCGDQQCSQV